MQRGARGVLLKGGHGTGPESADFLLMPAGGRWFTAGRIVTQHTHGTGCTLSSAIAAELAKGAVLEAAVATAKAFVTAAIAHADDLAVGRGRGPVHHFQQALASRLIAARAIARRRQNPDPHQPG